MTTVTAATATTATTATAAATISYLDSLTDPPLDHVSTQVNTDPTSTSTSTNTNNTLSNTKDEETDRVRRRRRHYKALHRLPFRHAPLREDEIVQGQGEEGGGGGSGPGSSLGSAWLHESDKASEWVDLFFDVVVVAVLSLFSVTHEIRTPAEIPIFFSYYVVLIWLWTTQVHYDVRYEGADSFHLVMKGAQIMVFVYIGAASGGWDPGKILGPDYVTNPTTGDEVAHSQAETSFLTVVAASAINRAILALQYGFVIYTGRRAGRHTSGPLLTMLALIASCILCIVAVSIPARSQPVADVQLAIFYLAIVVEVACFGYKLLWSKRGRDALSPQDVAARYGALSLIILGEGFSSLTRITSNAITGIEENSVIYYFQVLFVIIIIYNVWSFLFSNFRKGDVTSSSPAWISLWELIHFPLHFSILLLLAAMVNTIQISSFTNGLSYMTTYWKTAADALLDGTPLSKSQLTRTAIYLDRLGVLPTFQTQYQELAVYAAQQSPAQDPSVIATQYFGRLVIAVCGLSGVDISSSPLGKLDTLMGLNTSDTTNPTLYAEAEELMLDVITELVDDALTGILWLYPAAGGTLILCALRSMTRYRFNGHAHHIIHGAQLFCGTALGLLGFLAIGNRNVWIDDSVAQTNVVPMYILLEKQWAIPVVTLSYTFVNVVPMILLWVIHKRQGGVFEESRRHVVASAP